MRFWASPDALRAAGFTADAISYPHSEVAFRWLCRFNGVEPKDAPIAWRFASSAHMQGMIHARAMFELSPAEIQEALAYEAEQERLELADRI
jgi:hypothetical protein